MSVIQKMQLLLFTILLGFCLSGLECLFSGDRCTSDGNTGSCLLLTDCGSLMLEIQAKGNPLPRYFIKKLNQLNCGFQNNQPLVCCVSSSMNTLITKPNRSNNGDKFGGNMISNTQSDQQTTYPGRWESIYNPGSTNSRTERPSNDLWTGPLTTKPSNNESPWRTTKKPNWMFVMDRESNKNIPNNEYNNFENKKVDTGNGDTSPSDVSRHRNLRLLPNNCGLIDEDRIIGGNRSALFELPWTVLLAYDSPHGRKLSCGGTLINKNYVMTAAHCVSFLGSKLTLVGVVVGEHDIRGDPDCERITSEDLICAPSARNYTIDSVIPHPGYSPQTLYDDIALIRLAEPVDFSKTGHFQGNLMPICLPFTRELQNQDLKGVKGVVAGWGATEDGLLQSPVLLKVSLPIISNEDCQSYFKGYPKIYDRQLCAGGIERRDSCGGDSGGPLMYSGEVPSGGAKYIQYGIVSFGSKRCGAAGIPGIYTRVPYYMDWILDNIRD